MYKIIQFWPYEVKSALEILDGEFKRYAQLDSENVDRLSSSFETFQREIQLEAEILKNKVQMLDSTIMGIEKDDLNNNHGQQIDAAPLRKR